MGTHEQNQNISSANVNATMDEVIESVLNGNITINRKRIKTWSKAGVRNLRLRAEELGQNKVTRLLKI